MPPLDWSRISDQPRFNALIRAIVARLDPLPHRAWLPTRPGRDLAIDARSGDGKTVWQFKHHQPMERPDRILSDARKTAKDIEKARSNKNGASAWDGINHWVLATSLLGNTQLYTRWDAEIAPAFLDLGLVAELMDVGKLEERLRGLPDVVQHFFGAEDACFESLWEVRQERLADQPGAARDIDHFLVDPVGRDDEIATALDRLQRFSLVEVVGAGGVGKSRFLLEVAERAQEAGAFEGCRSGLVEALKDNPGWRRHLPSSRTLVLIDEPDRKLRASIEEVARREPVATGTAFLVALRSVDAGRVRPGHEEPWRAPSLELRALPERHAREFAHNYMAASVEPGKRWREGVAEEVAHLCGGLPVWIATAVSCLAAGRNLPARIDELARDQVERGLLAGIDATAQAGLLAILRWLALVQPVRSDASDVQMLSRLTQLSPEAVETGLETLATLRLVRRRGRLLEAHPDTLADAIVRNWLLRETSASGALQLSHAGQELVARLLGHAGTAPIEHVERILERLARVESMAGRPADLLGEILHQALSDARLAADARAQKRLLEYVTPLAYWRPVEVIDVLAALREQEVPDESEEIAPGYFSSTARQDVLLALPWAVYSAGCGAQDEVQARKILHELLELVRVEARLLGDDPERARNDGKRAFAVVGKLVHPSRHHPTSFLQAAWQELKPLLDCLVARDALPAEDLAVVRCLARPLLRLEFHDDWRDGWAVHVQKRRIRDEEALQARDHLREALWSVVAGDTAPAVHRKATWGLLHESHSHAAELEAPDCRAQRADDLRRTAELLESGANPLDVWESRQIWQWHLKYDDDADAKVLAQRCAEAFRRHKAVFELARLCRMMAEPEDLEADEPARAAAVDQWAARSGQEIQDFLRTSLSLADTVGDARLRSGVFQVAADIGWSGWNRAAVQDLSHEAMRGAETDVRELGVAIAIGYLARAARELPVETWTSWLSDALLWPADTNAQAELARRLYQEFGALTQRQLSILELEILWPHLQVLVMSAPKEALAIVGRFAVVDVDAARTRARDLMQRLPVEQLSPCYEALIGGMSHGCFQEHGAGRKNVPTAIRAWLQELLGEIPDLDFRDTHEAWWLREVFVAVPITLLEVFLILDRRLHLGPVLAERYGQDALDGCAAFRRTWRPIPISFEFERLVGRGDVQSDLEAIRSGLARLLQTVLDASWEADGFPELLHKIEPSGEIVASEVEALLDAIDPSVDLDRFRRAAGLIAEYHDASAPWRTVATKAFARLGPGVSESLRRSMISALAPSGRGVWSGTPGEVPPRFQAAVDRARQLLDEEIELLLLPYRRAALEAAEHELECWRAHAEEEGA